jgi:formylglycine-generating enzyme required for sulfatase activity
LSLEVIINDASGRRTLGEQDLPLNIGTAADSVIRIPGPVTGGHVAQIGMLDGRAFVQVPGEGNVSVNGSAVVSTCWLDVNDELTVGGLSIRCKAAMGQLQVDVGYHDSDYITAPPILEVSQPDETKVIKPVLTRAGVAATKRAAARKRALSPAVVALGLLIVAAVYMFAAVTVVIESNAPAAEISLPGSWLTPGADGRYLLWPGNYQVLIEAQGFYPYTDQLEVNSGGRAEFNVVLQELPGRLAVSTQPAAEGEVWVNDELVGLFPADEILLDKGRYELRLKTERYLEYVGFADIVGRDQLQSFSAELVPGWADVEVSTNPPGAEILLDGETLGQTPASVELLAGVRELEIRKAGFRTERRTLSIVAGQPEVLPLVELQEAGGFIDIQSEPPGAAVNIAGRFEGNTPLQLEVAKGRNYKVQLRKAGYQPVTRAVDVDDGTPVLLAVDLQPNLGKVNVVATPADATLYVDGRPVGNATQNLELMAVPHRLEVRKEGFESWSAKVTPTPGLPQRLDVRLLTRQQAVIAAVPKTITTSQGQVLRLIEPGSFQMGAPRREQGRRPNEVNKSVQLTRWFYISVKEVTNREYRAFDPQHTSGAEKYRELAADDNPAVMLSWAEAAAYCNWLSDRDGLPRAYVSDGDRYRLTDPPTEGYRLPTEAEWAWVARYNAGGGQLKYPWGAGMPPPANAGNFADSYAVDVAGSTIGGYTDGYPVTSPVGSFPASPLGIYDLGGNVAEWVNDLYTVSAGTGEKLIDPVGPADGQYYVIRGSSWRQASISELRFAYRDFGDRGRLDVGFRIARYAPLTGQK